MKNKQPKTDDLGRTAEVMRREAQDAEAVANALAALVERGYLLSPEFREAVQKLLHLLAAAETRWRHQSKAVRQIVPELLLQKRSGMLSRIQNELDVEKAKKAAEAAKKRKAAKQNAQAPA